MVSETDRDIADWLWGNVDIGPMGRIGHEICVGRVSRVSSFHRDEPYTNDLAELKQIAVALKEHLPTELLVLMHLKGWLQRDPASTADGESPASSDANCRIDAGG